MLKVACVEFLPLQLPTAVSSGEEEQVLLFRVGSSTSNLHEPHHPHHHRASKV